MSQRAARQPRQPATVTRIEDVKGGGEAVRTAAAIAEAAARQPRPTLTLSNGIELRVRPVPPLAMREIAVQLRPPPVPVVFIESKGREEENPNDPDYLRALIEYSSKQVETLTNLLITLGTEIVNIPEGMDRPEDSGWLDILSFLHIDIDVSNPLQRYLSWMRYYALGHSDDITQVVQRTMQVSGTGESEVQAIIASFRGVPRR